jgi:flagellin-like hook-associated protein FlgL
MINNNTQGPSITVNGQSFNVWGLEQPAPQYGFPVPIPADHPSNTGWENTYRLYRTADGSGFTAVDPSAGADPPPEHIDIIQMVFMDGLEYRVEYTVQNRTDININYNLRHHVSTELEGETNLQHGGGTNGISLRPNIEDPTLEGLIGVHGNGGILNINPSGDPDNSDYEVLWNNLTLAPDANNTVSTFYSVGPLPVPPVLISGAEYNMDDQYLYIECAAHTLLPVNSLAKNVYTDKMYTDLKRLIEFAESLNVSDHNTLVEHFMALGLTEEQAKREATQQISNETAKLSAVLHDRFNNMLYLMDRHAAVANKEHSQFGARLYRFDLLYARMEEEEEVYTKLMSSNEDTDMIKALILKAAAEAAYIGSLQASSNVMNLTLANFVRF